jgi:DNA-binding transcriptional LysR family regulator
MYPRQLEAFRAVMMAGTVTRAAEMLSVSQPAVSKLIAQLEARCGFALFQRRGGRLVVTPEAELLFDEVDRLFAGVEAVVQAAADIRALRAGRLRVAAFPALATRLLPRLVAAFLSDYPGVQVMLESRRSRPLTDWLAANRADIGIGLLPSERPGVENELLCRCEGVCVLPAGHRLAGCATVRAEDLRDEPFVSLGREDRSRFGVDQIFDDLGVRRDILIETEQSESACAFVAAGRGIAVTDPFSAYEFGERGVVVRRFRPAVHFTVWLLYPAHRRRARMTVVFAEHLAAEIRDYVARRLLLA